MPSLQNDLYQSMKKYQSDKPGVVILEGHLQGLSNLRSLGELGIPAFVVDTTRCVAQYSRFCTKHFRCPPFQSPDFVPFLIQLARKEGIKDWLLMPSNDHIVEQLSTHRDELSAYYRMAVPNTATLEMIVDKWQLYTVASEIGTPTPHTYIAATLGQAQQLNYPVIVKGRRGLSFYKHFHCKAMVATNPRELAGLTADSAYPDYLVQEQVSNAKNEVLSFTCFAIDGIIKSYWVGTKLREHPPKYGTATLAQSVEDPGLLQLSAPLIAKLNYTGICEIEFMLDDHDGQYKLIEINPRTWLWVGLARRCGKDFAKMLYRHLAGIPQQFPTDYTVGTKWINTMTDLPYSILSILKGHLTIADYFKSLQGKKVHAAWSTHDPLPAIMLLLLTPTILKHRR